jgi:hypothetical protein
MVVAFTVRVAMLLVDKGVAIAVAEVMARDVIVICDGGIGSVCCIVCVPWQGWWRSW